MEADTSTRIGSRLYEVNEFMWKYGRPRTRTQTIEEAKAMRSQKPFESAAVRKRWRTRQASRHNEEMFRVTFEDSGSEPDSQHPLSQAAAFGMTYDSQSEIDSDRDEE